MFVGICNPDALNIRIYNPKIALKMLIISPVGLQIRPNLVRRDLQSRRIEYQDLKSENRIKNAYNQPGRITNPTEQPNNQTTKRPND